MSTDKFHPTWATKPKPKPAATFAVDAPYAPAADTAPKSTSPPAKPPQYAAAPAPAPMLYRPQRSSSPNRPRSRRRCCCSCLLFTCLFLLVLILLVALTAAIFYAIYRPHRPTFSLSSLHVAALNLSSASAFSSSLALSISARNPNSKISFSYDPIAVSVFSSSVQIAAGKLPAFVHPAKNTTHLATSVTDKGLSLHSSEISTLKSAVKKDKGLDLEIRMETKARVKVGKSKSKKLRVRISCTGIKANADSKEKFSGTVKTSSVKCKAKLRFKIWKWNLSW